MTEHNDDIYRRVAHDALKTTHVIVGDHAPEPRVAPGERRTFARFEPSSAPRWDACSGFVRGRA